MGRLRSLGGAAGPGVFIATWALAGAHSKGYSPLQDPISRLAAVGAPTRVAMTAGFIAFGAGVGAYSFDLRNRVSGRAGTAALMSAIGGIAIAATPLDSAAGGAPHALAAGLTYASLAATPLLAARPLAATGRGGAAAASVVSGLVVGAFLVASVATGTRTGLWQRLGLTVGDAWLIASALSLARGRVDPGEVHAAPHPARISETDR